MTSYKNIISLKNVEVKISSKILLQDINVEIAQGELVSLVGSNGAGKSTFLKILTGILPATSGSVQVFEHHLHSGIKKKELKQLRSQVGQVFQGLHLVPRLTALENILIGRLSKNKSFKTWARLFNKEDHRIAAEAMDLVGITLKSAERVDRLSGGERQKVAIARALAQESYLLLADEPTSNLDPLAAVEIAKLLHYLVREKKMTIVTVIHDLNLLNYLGGRVIGLKKTRMNFDYQMATVSIPEIEKIYSSEVL